MMRLSFLIGVVVIAVGCGGGSKAVECGINADCNLGPGGSCSVNPATNNLWCQYPCVVDVTDELCESGRCWSDFETGDGLSGVCVDPALADAGPADGPNPIDARIADAGVLDAAVPRTWQGAELIEIDNNGAWDPQIGIDAAGNAIAVWKQAYGGTTSCPPGQQTCSIWANRYVAGTGWDTAELIGASDSRLAQKPHVAVNATGNAVAVWIQWNASGTAFDMWSNRYVVGIGWGTAQVIETDDVGTMRAPHVGTNANGSSIAVWSREEGGRYDIWSNRHMTSWGTTEIVEMDNFGLEPRVAVDAEGNAIAVWERYDMASNRYDIAAVRFTAATGWGTPLLIETDNSGDARLPQVAVNAAGDAIVIWRQSDGTRDNIWANRYVPGAGWGAAELIETDNAGGASSPRVTIDAAGNAIAVWTQSDGTRNNIWANRYTVGTSWGTAQLIETDNAGHANSPAVGVDGAGNTIAVWSQSDGTRNNIWTNRHVIGADWGTPELIETNNAAGANWPQIAVNANGSAVAVWQQSDGSRINIWANRFE